MKNVSIIVPSRVQLLVLGHCGFMNIYAPSGSDKKQERALFFSRDIFCTLSLNSNLSWLLAGDYNCILSAMDVENGVGFKNKNCPQLSELVKAKKLVDIFRRKNPNLREYTFNRGNAAASRLDRIYLSEHLYNDSIVIKIHY